MKIFNMFLTKKKIIAYWSNKSVVITGASSGLGWAVVEALAPYQNKFCLLSRREENMLQLALKLKDSGSTFWIRKCDVRNRDEVYDAVKAFHEQTGRIDAVWVNSGVGGSSAFDEWEWDRIEALIDTNIKGAIYTIRACLEYMIPQGSGTIIGIGSATAMRGIPTRGVYSMTKIGLEYFMESLAGELPLLRFTMIHPGFVETPIIRKRSNIVWLVSPEKAARLMVKAVAEGRRHYIYPFRMRLLYHVVRALPSSVYFALARKIVIER